MALARAVEASAHKPWYAHAWRIAGLLLLAAIAITLGLLARTPHTVHALAATSVGPQVVAVKATPKDSTTALALASVVTGAVSAIAAVASTAVAVVALRGHRS